MQNKKQKSEAHDAPAPKSLRLARSAADAQKALNPACPGVIKTRPKTCLVKLPHQDAYEVFKKLKADGNFEYEEAWLKLITCYDDADMKTAEEILSGKRVGASFSTVTYDQVVPYVFLDPKKEGHGIKRLHIHGSRLPHAIFYELLDDENIAVKG